MNSCYSGPEKPHDPYDDWPDGEEGKTQEMPQVVVERNEPAFGGGGESLKVPAEHWVAETEEEEQAEPEMVEQEEEERRLVASPSEVGEIV